MNNTNETRLIFKTLLLSGFLLLIGFILINIFHFNFAKQTFKKGILESTLPGTVSFISRTLEDLNSQYALSSELVAKSVGEDLNLTGSRDDPRFILSYLRAWRDDLNIKNIGLVDLSTQSYYDCSGQILSLDYSSDRDKWVLEMLDNPTDSRYTLYDPYEKEYEYLYSFFYDQKIRNPQGEVIGLIGLGLSFETLYRRVENFDDNLKISFLNDRAVIRLPMERRGENPSYLYEIENLDLAEIGEGDQFLHWYNRKDQSVLVVIRYVPEIKRHLLIELDISDRYWELRNQYIFTVLVGAIFSLIVIAINLIYIYRSGSNLRRKAYHDPLTDCFNRVFLDHILTKDRRFHMKSGESPYLVCFDIDFFKKVNDQLGHLKGDEVLVKVSQIAKSKLRSGDYLIRLGGDEFLLILNMDEEEALAVSERLRYKIKEQTLVTISMGITAIYKSDTLESALTRADEALYISKENGRNCINRSD